MTKAPNASIEHAIEIAQRLLDLENNVVQTTEALLKSLTEIGNLTFAISDAVGKQHERIKGLQHRIEAIETKD